MYILKNALRCISRARVRNALIGIIIFAISLSACVGLSIRRAAEKAKQETMNSLSVTATISFDRQSAIKDMAPPDSGEKSGGSSKSFDRAEFSNFMGQSSSLSLEEYQAYAEASTVKDFYYTATVSVNGNSKLEPVSNETDTADSDFDQAQALDKGFGGGKNFIKGMESDFSLIGVSGESAMTDFISGNAAVTEGEIFTQGTTEMECIISTELATYNDLEIGKKITLVNPNNEDETYKFKVVGFFTDSSANQSTFSGMGSTSGDPANKIYISYNALAQVLAASQESSTTTTDSDTGREYETGLEESLSATYSFANVEDYGVFEQEVRDMGLSEDYIVSSSDATEFEKSLIPLNTLSGTAGYFLWVILGIGAIILVVLNIFSVRERKYEIGVLTAMGMKKGKVALQFLTEVFAVSIIAVIIGASVGAVASVPVANGLLANQIEATEASETNTEQSFGRGGMSMPDGGDMMQSQKGGFGDKLQQFTGEAVDYVDEISGATDFTVLMQLLGIALCLTVIAGGFSVLFIMRYEPLKILSNRD